MKKVEIITMQQVDNYGSVLQAYSLKKMLEDLGCQVTFSDIEKGQNALLNSQCEVGDMVQKAANTQKRKNLFRRIRVHIRGRISTRKLNKIFGEFRVKTGLVSNEKSDRFDVCVIGSDEVFNCMQKVEWGFSTQLFGNVKNADKVITYAASCGFTKAEMLSRELKKEVVNAMSHLSAISVRDANTAEFVQKLTGREYTYNLDPVAVGDFTEEVSNAEVSSKLPTRYCIIYAYSNRFHAQKEITAITNYCKAHDLKVVSLFGEQEWVGLYDKLTPFEVLKAFENAECIITDTFHGTLFGAKFGKRMAVLIRESNRNKLEDLTKRLQIEEHVVADISELEEALNKRLDREKIQSILNMERERTITYLSNNLT